MKISTILDHIDSGYMALPEFQRGYVWGRDQVRQLVQSLYRRYPVGSLLVWATESKSAQHRGEAELAPGVVKLLLDGQQRMTSLYGIIRGKPPAFFDGNAKAFTGLRFHLETEELAFYQPIKMKDDAFWIDVTQLMKEGVGGFFKILGGRPDADVLFERLNRLHTIREIDLHIEEVTGEDKNIDVVVDIFNRVNSGGTKLSQGDLALAKVCAELPEARDRMKGALAKWRAQGYDFKLDWLLRNVNTIATDDARFSALHQVDAETFADGLIRAEAAVDFLLDLIAGRFGLDHDRVFFGRYALPAMARYVDQRGCKVSDAVERDHLLFWYLQSALWGRYSGSTETKLSRDLDIIRSGEGLEGLIGELRLSRGSLRIRPEDFGGSSLGARFYPMLYLMTRTGQAVDWGSGIPLKKQLLGKNSTLEVHHIFPKKRLRDAGYVKKQVNAIANFCFLTKGTNLAISASDPAVYLAEIEERFPGALASQWVPTDPKLWHVDRYLDFLAERRVLLAAAANALMEDLLHGTPLDVGGATPAVAASAADVPGGLGSEDEERELRELNAWVAAQGLHEGELEHELVDPQTGLALAVLDLAWPDGLQQGLGEPVAVLLDEPAEVLARASATGYRCFVDVAEFRRYVEGAVGGEGDVAAE